MSWRENLLSASFRGIPFKVFNTATQVGRRNVLHQFPFKDTPFVEDLGKDADQFNIVGYVLATVDNDYDYFNERDALIAALRKEGPGTLYHPFLGELKVNVLSKAQITESFNEGGIARFVMTFVQAEDIEFASAITEKDWSDSLSDAADTARDHWYDSFVAIYDAAIGAVEVISDIQDTVSSYTAMVKGIISSITSLPQAAISNALSIVNSVESTLVSLLSAPCDFAGGIGNGLNSLKYLAGLYTEDVSAISYDVFGECSGEKQDSMDAPDQNEAKTEVVKKLLELCDFGQTTTAVSGSGEDVIAVSDLNEYGGNLTGITVTTPVNAIEGANRIAMVDLIRALAIILGVEIAATIDYASYDDAVDLLTQITDRVNELILKVGNEVENDPYSDYGVNVANENGYSALLELRSDLVEAMSNIGADLAKVIEYEVPYAVIPTLVLSYDRYEDLGRESEILNRNYPEISHPGFLPSGETIELLHE